MSSADETVVNYRKPRPSPGGRLDKTQVTVKPEPALPGSCKKPATRRVEMPLSSEDPLAGGQTNRKAYENPLNPLLAAAQPLVDQIAWLQNVGDVRQPDNYRQALVTAVTQFERRCGLVGVDEDNIIYARYVLCTVLDEMVNKTPWSDKGEWNRQSLLAQFHGETGGGEKYFDLLDHLQLHPASHLDVLELMLVCLNMGFEGKYHLVPRGLLELEQAKDNLFQLIRLQRGEPEQALSPHWHATSAKAHTLIGYIPAWVVLAVTGLLLLTMFSGFRYLIDGERDRVVQQIESLPLDPDDSGVLTSAGESF